VSTSLQFGNYDSIAGRFSLGGTPFHKHLFDVTPLPEQELVLDLVVVIGEPSRGTWRKPWQRPL
jgi:hypothetical protein